MGKYGENSAQSLTEIQHLTEFSEFSKYLQMFIRLFFKICLVFDKTSYIKVVDIVLINKFYIDQFSSIDKNAEKNRVANRQN